MTKQLQARDYFKLLPIAMNQILHVEESRLHTHTFMELVVVLGGSATHFTSDDSYEIRAGNCFVIEGEHGYKNCKKLHVVNVMFKPDELKIPWSEARKIPGFHAFFAIEPRYKKKHTFRCTITLSPIKLSLVTDIIERLKNEILEEETGFEFSAMALFMELICFLSRAYRTSGISPVGHLKGLPETISFLERNYHEEITIARLVKMSGVSEKVLCGAFKEATGKTPIEYLLELRISNACTMLRDPELTISEIAYRTGFNDSNYFTRQFRALLGVSPRAYRKTK